MTEVAIDSYLQKVASVPFIRAVGAYGLERVATQKGVTLWEKGSEVPGLNEANRFGIQTLRLTFAKPITNFMNFAAALKVVPGAQFALEYPRRPGQFPGILPADVQKADQAAAAAAAAAKKAYQQTAKAPVAKSVTTTMDKGEESNNTPVIETKSEPTPPGVFVYRDGKIEDGTIQKAASGEFWAILRIPVKEDGSETTEKRFMAKSEKALIEKMKAAVGDTLLSNKKEKDEESMGSHVIKMTTLDYRKKKEKLPLNGGDEIDIVKPFKIVNGVITNGDIMYDDTYSNYWGVWRKPPNQRVRTIEEADSEEKLIENIKEKLELFSKPV